MDCGQDLQRMLLCVWAFDASTGRRQRNREGNWNGKQKIEPTFAMSATHTIHTDSIAATNNENGTKSNLLCFPEFFN